jgi:hypothetical protein
MVCAALCAQLAVVCVIAEWPLPAAAVTCVGIALITWSRRATATPDGRPPCTLPSRVLRSFCAAGLAVAFTAAGLTPYLAIDGGADGHDGLTQQLPLKHRGQGRPEEQSGKQGFFQKARVVLGAFLASKTLSRSNNGATAAKELSQGAYSALDAMFGEGKTASAAGSRWPRRSDKNVAMIEIGESYAGMILRPKTKERVIFVPPLPKQRIFDLNRNTQRVEPLTIPFSGIYWFFRSSDGGLPADSIESRGDPSSISFRTTDLTPLSMEARQNFGSLIDLSCCKAIQVTISNGDRRPNTVSLELILVNTTLREQPRQSLGKAPVNSSLHWRPADERTPVVEVLNFAMPAHPGIEKFDEVVIRFELSSPRQVWSAKIGIDHLRFLPRGI